MNTFWHWQASLSWYQATMLGIAIGWVGAGLTMLVYGFWRRHLHNRQLMMRARMRNACLGVAVRDPQEGPERRAVKGP